MRNDKTKASTAGAPCRRSCGDKFGSSGASADNGIAEPPDRQHEPNREQPGETTIHRAAVDERDISRGIAYLHNRLNATAGRAFEAASFTYALIELLEEKKLISLQEIDDRKEKVAGRLLKKFRRHDHGVSVQESATDKYDMGRAVSIDCADRVALCTAACCKMVFPLSPQDIAEGIITWDLGAPYVIAKDEDGYCRHFDRSRRACAQHESRPLPCRVYDCRNDERIWKDFAAHSINPKLLAADWPRNLEEKDRTREPAP